jgi:ubiquinone/menaquinone biosynthesis C-methylase UbiE
MSPIRIYAAKAAKYAHYRWRYASRAIETIFEKTRLGQTSQVIELGAGTGILTREITPRLKHVYAIEPDMHLIGWIREGLPAGSPISVITAQAEAVPLPTGSADAVMIAQAIHWFNPPAARSEIQRLLKKEGWLVLLRNYGVDAELSLAYQSLNSAENGIRLHSQLSSFEPQPIEYYYGHAEYKCFRFPFSQPQDWEAFFGGLCSASFVPEEDHPLFPRFKEQARKVFDTFSKNGSLETQGETELLIGQVIGSSQ